MYARRAGLNILRYLPTYRGVIQLANLVRELYTPPGALHALERGACATQVSTREAVVPERQRARQRWA